MKKYIVTISFTDGRKAKLDSNYKPEMINNAVRVGEISLMPNTINYYTYSQNKKATNQKYGRWLIFIYINSAKSLNVFFGLPLYVYLMPLSE